MVCSEQNQRLFQSHGLNILSCNSVHGSECIMDAWDQFADNLATDLAPLISLFGERLTKQFLSESISLLDNFIFALAPLGILTALVSAIRVCGSSSLRAFVGRAQEGPGEAESELLSCVSETTGELFNDTGISRIFGRPRILEVVVWEDYDPHTRQNCWKIGTLRDAHQQGAWSARHGKWILDEKGYLPELDIPNLSLNKGIERRSQVWFYCAAVLGLILQIGIIMYGAVTVFIYPESFQKNGRPVEDYAFPLFLFGTLLLCTGMFFCAFIIERSSSECYLHAEKPSKLYWLQPGRQNVGDQVFDAFLGVTEGSKSQASEELIYIKSVRNHGHHGNTPILLTGAVTVVGFIAQFVGLRGLHATVTLAQLGATLLMAIVRTCLRTKRIGPEQNRLKGQERHLVSYKHQELDSFAFHLENGESFGLVSNMTRTPSSSYQPSISSTAPTDVSIQSSGTATRLVQTRARLAELTSENDKNSNVVPWDDLPIRQTARNLADAIEMTMDLISTWKGSTKDTDGFDLSLICQPKHKSIAPILETYTIMLERADDTLQWRVNDTELEAVIGLWTWSLLKSDPKWRHDGLGRVVGLSESEARAPETDLYFHKWIFRQTEAKMVSTEMIALPQQMFGYYSDDHSDDKEILVVRTKNHLETMIAQDIYIQFLRSALEGLEDLGGETNILPGSQNRLIGHNSRINDLVGCFESSGLGSREDALLCIVPVLRHRALLPSLSANSDFIRKHIKNLIDDDKWSESLSIVYWLCERCEGEEFVQSAHELGYLCRLAIIDPDPKAQAEGLRFLKLAMQGDPRTLFFKTITHRSVGWLDTADQTNFWTSFSLQLGWLMWHIAESHRDKQPTRDVLEGHGIDHNSLPSSKVSNCEDLGRKGRQVALDWLATSDQKESPDDEERLALDWVCQNDHHTLLNWLITRWFEFNDQCTGFIWHAITWSAEGKYRTAMALLLQKGVDLSMQGSGTATTAMVYEVTKRKPYAVQELLEAGAEVDGRGSTGETPLMIASHLGYAEIVMLLLDYGAQTDARDNEGLSPLIISALSGHTDVTQILLDHGANANFANHHGWTPLISAAGENQLDVMRLLLSRGADINAQATDGSTALIVAALNRFTTAMKFLLDHGANIHLRTNSGETAFDWVRINHSAEELMLLKSTWAKDGIDLDS